MIKNKIKTSRLYKNKIPQTFKVVSVYVQVIDLFIKNKQNIKMSSVKARTSLFESGEAFNKKKPQPQKKKQNKKNVEEEEDEGAFQFADLVKVRSIEDNKTICITF